MSTPNMDENAKLWFGVQLEVTQKLLAAEDRKLEVMHHELSGQHGTLSGLRRLANSRLRMQYDQLNKEYEDAVTGLLRGNTLARVRSLPSMGLKGVHKQRSSLFHAMNIQAGPVKDGDQPDAAATKQLEENVTEIGAVGAEDTHDGLTFARGRVQSGSLSHPDSVPMRVAKLLREWTETYSYDFRDERMMLPFKDITQACASYMDDVKAAVLDIQRVLFKKLNALEQYEAKLKRELELQIKTKNETMSAGKSKPDRNLFDLSQSPQEVAAQLKVIEFERLSAIGPEEFVQTFVRGDQKDEYTDMREAHNVETYVEWFNRLSYIVATEILRTEKKKHQVKAIEFFVQVGHHCYKMHNFNSVMAIVSAINFASVSRLKKAWSKVPGKILSLYEELEWVLEPRSNFKNYREEVASLMLQQDTCVIPIFSLMVKDMYFTEESSKKRLANGDIDFDTMWRLGNRLADFMVLKNAKCKQPRNDDVVRYLKTVPVCSEYELFKLSIESEPPAKEDKERTLGRLKRLETQSQRKTAEKDAK
ncbi:hypothetical protein PTSG_12059 [Salpingoeca rosetta]|uniref:Ras-GEF domain-containing protein n=1 Tax=Salpingoeca rosetta (strain ATCC 50818 / BSB-021) TaxID=946362 RepID=F2U6C0_SALR5|nr:uncharacterized protein PTSG_12059 [Salpingoeca rosetta]EGD83061.1 hypothetical protein PTSG_12059 [Salpingoeca rosetta]|eukprot:XP_004995425.1 hypothetical protein PTSG_12059 [Salpingoeca rosetta]